jgi:MGT family glycosyltransferase
MKRRFLFLAIPLTGHVNPMAAVAHALHRRGHEVAWVGSESFLRPLLGVDATVYPMGLRLHRGQGDRGMAAIRSRWAGYIVPHTRYTLPTVDRAVAEFRPDVLVVDQHAVAGALVAHRHGLPWASVALSSSELTRPFRALPKVEAWILGQLAAMWTAAGLPGEPPHDLRFSPHLVIACTSQALAGPVSLPGPVEYVGAVLAERPPGPEFPWDRLDPARHHVLITMGTLAMDLAEGFYRRMVDALRPLGDRLQAIMVVPDGTVTGPPAHILTFTRVPMLELMPHMDAVVSHGALNTVAEALAHGVPLVVAPINGDQPVNAPRVVATGAGLRVRVYRSGAEELRAAVLTVLDDPAYRAAAGRIRDSFTAAGGAPAAAVHLERLAGHASGVPDFPPHADPPRRVSMTGSEKRT